MNFNCLLFSLDWIKSFSRILYTRRSHDQRKEERVVLPVKPQPSYDAMSMGNSKTSLTIITISAGERSRGRFSPPCADFNSRAYCRV